MKKILAAILVLTLLSSAIWYFTTGDKGNDTGFRFVQVERGTLEAVVSSTGTLDAVTTVEVGTQVSGIISEILVDFNETVSSGQVIAKLDTTLLSLAVSEASSNLDQAEAKLRFATQNFERVGGLYEEEVISEADFISARYDYESALASVDASQIKLKLAEKNLSYATILAPIDGTVIERDVDVGQTVAASLSAPRFFLIAEDLSHMQILATVDESDIGLIQEGQPVRFSVQAWPDNSFEGSVDQVRLQSNISENVVTYTVIVKVDNSDMRLLPGMTATVEFVVETADNALIVPNAALRFRATESMTEELEARREERRQEREYSEEGGRQGRPGMRPGASGQMPEDMAILYFIDEDGRLDAAPCRTGLSDGSSTVIESRRIEEGMQLIAGIVKNGESSGSSNPFQSESGSRRGPPGPGF